MPDSKRQGYVTSDNTNEGTYVAYQAVMTCAQKNPQLATVFTPKASSAQGAAQAAKELGAR